MIWLFQPTQKLSFIKKTYYVTTLITNNVTKYSWTVGEICNSSCNECSTTRILQMQFNWPTDFKPKHSCHPSSWVGWGKRKWYSVANELKDTGQKLLTAHHGHAPEVLSFCILMQFCRALKSYLFGPLLNPAVAIGHFQLLPGYLIVNNDCDKILRFAVVI